MITGFKCHSCNGFIPLTSQPKKMYFKWKDKSRMTQVQVCFKCWSRAKSLKVPEWT